METIDDDGNSATEDITTTQLLDQTRYGIVSRIQKVLFLEMC